LLAFGSGAAPVFAAGGQAACAALTAPGTFEQTAVKSATFIAGDQVKKTPAFCEVAAVVTPAEDSSIGVTYRLPESWNGKMLGLGGGGWAGNVRRETALPGLEQATPPRRRTVATMSTMYGTPRGPPALRPSQTSAIAPFT
jgi:feruloyl esterase